MELKLKILQVKDVTQTYVNWYSNADIVRYSDNSYRTFTFDGQCAYVHDCLHNPNTDLYGIFDKDLHIANIVIDGLNSPHKRAELTYIVGQTSYWGKGIGYFAVSSLVALAKNKYNLNKLYAGCADGNVGSKRVLEKNGFILEGTRLKHLFYNDQYHNQLDYGLLL